MKKIISILKSNVTCPCMCAMLTLFSINTIQAQTTSPTPYCTATYDDDVETGPDMGVPHYISKVSLGTLTNNSGTTQYPGGHYVFYDNLSAPSLAKGSTYTLTINHDGGASIHFLLAYIDFNNNGLFTDPGERIFQKTINDPSIPNPAIVSITIPATAIATTTRMRVMVFEDDDYTFTDNNLNGMPCTAYSGGSIPGSFLDWGETEDYKINITGSSVGINDMTSEDEVTIFPNPSSGSFNIQTKDWSESIQLIAVYNLFGENIFSEKNLSGNYYKLNLTLPNGIYSVQIQTLFKKISSKIIISN